MSFRVLPRRRALLSAALLLPAASMGCELFDQVLGGKVELPPIPLETPPQEIDVTARVEAAEDAICEDRTSEDCLVLIALDGTDGSVEEPPRLPPEFPARHDPDGPGPTEEIDVEQWAKDQGLNAAASDLKVAVPVDLSGQVNVEDESAIQDVRFDTVAVNFQSNTLTFDTIPLDLYASVGPVEDLSDPDALIASGAVEKIGTIEAKAAGETGDAPVTFVEGGNAIFNEALKSLSFALVVAVPEGTQVALPRTEDGENLVKPLGKASLSVKASVIYTVNAADVVQGVEEATGGGEEG